MRFLKGRARTERPEEAGSRRCAFCERAVDARSVVAVRDGRGGPAGHSCASCEKRHASFAARLTYDHVPGQRPWLMPDPGTAHAVLAGPAPFGAVHAVVEGLNQRIHDVHQATARIAARRFGLYRLQAPASCESREEAIGAVGALIAEELARHHASVRRFGDGREWARYAVALFGEGCGVLLSRVGTEGDRIAQHCFLIDFGHAVHPYTAWHRA